MLHGLLDCGCTHPPGAWPNRSNRTTVAASPAPLWGRRRRARTDAAVSSTETHFLLQSQQWSECYCHVLHVPPRSSPSIILSRPSRYTLPSSDTGVHVVSRRFEYRECADCGVLSFAHMRSHLHVVWKVRECGLQASSKRRSTRSPTATDEGPNWIMLFTVTDSFLPMPERCRDPIPPAAHGCRPLAKMI